MIRNWLRAWLGIDRAIGGQILELAQAQLKDSRRFERLENEIARIEQACGADIQELRDRLEMPAKRKASGRPYGVLVKVAELGAQAQRMKDAG